MMPRRHVQSFSGQIIANTVAVPMETDPFLSLNMSRPSRWLVLLRAIRILSTETAPRHTYVCTQLQI